MTLIVTVVREHSDIENTVVDTDEEARAWLVKALFMVEEGELAADAPTPSIEQLEAYSNTLGWDISIQRPSVR